MNSRTWRSNFLIWFCWWSVPWLQVPLCWSIKSNKSYQPAFVDHPFQTSPRLAWNYWPTAANKQTAIISTLSSNERNHYTVTTASTYMTTRIATLWHRQAVPLAQPSFPEDYYPGQLHLDSRGIFPSHKMLEACLNFVGGILDLSCHSSRWIAKATDMSPLRNTLIRCGKPWNLTT